jgi:NitT/TauT family transport system ATP-binding protein
MHLSIRYLSHTYPGRPPRPALAELTVEIASGQFVAIVGPSGCGKSTLLRLAAGLIQPSGGGLLLDGQPPQQAARARRTAWVAQSPALLPWLTGRANAALALRFHRRDTPPRLTPAEALRRVGLADAAGAYPFTLSGGMQQRLALARTLLLDADLWLMDEPFAALDELTREQLSAELLELWQPLRPTVLWVTHNIYEALRLADRVLVLSPHPARLLADIPILLPHPRRESDPAFQTLLAGLRSTLGLNGGSAPRLTASEGAA